VAAIDSQSIPKSKERVELDNSKLPRVEFCREEIERAQAGLYNEFEPIRDKKLVLIYPGGGILPIRAWPLNYYRDLSKNLIQRGYAVAVIGLEADKHLAAEIRSFCNHPACIDLTGYTKSVHELMLVFHLAALLITNDGGPGHFAAMTPVPSIILYGPETPELYGPVDEKAEIFYEPLPCSPCLTAYNHRHSPCDGDNLCLKQITPEQVLVKALRILEPPPS
jgi:ADP-heptose:LPS heptosyltransferase